MTVLADFFDRGESDSVVGQEEEVKRPKLRDK